MPTMPSVESARTHAMRSGSVGRKPECVQSNPTHITLPASVQPEALLQSRRLALPLEELSNYRRNRIRERFVEHTQPQTGIQDTYRASIGEVFEFMLEREVERDILIGTAFVVKLHVVKRHDADHLPSIIPVRNSPKVRLIRQAAIFPGRVDPHPLFGQGGVFHHNAKEP